MNNTSIQSSTLVAALLLAVAGSLNAQTDDFNDGDDMGWTRYDPLVVGTWSFPNGNSYRIQTTATTVPQNPSRAGSLRQDVTLTNFYITVDIVNWDDTVDQAFGILARVKEPGFVMTDGYAFTYDRGTSPTSGDMDISFFENEVPGGISTTVNQDVIHFVPGRSYRLVFQGAGINLEGRVYELPNTSTPVARIVGTDSRYTSGFGGLVVFDTSGNSATDATFDNYFALPVVPPTLRIEYMAPTITVRWPTNGSDGFRLEGTPDLTPPQTWTDLSLSVIDVGDEYFYSEDASMGNRFFRTRLAP